jgi:thiol-disulfide isomerase/thioredoxin
MLTPDLPLIPALLSCRNLAPVYEQLADAFPTGKVLIAKTDADGAGKSLGKRFGVKGYPSESRDSTQGAEGFVDMVLYVYVLISFEVVRT